MEQILSEDWACPGRICVSLAGGFVGDGVGTTTSWFCGGTTDETLLAALSLSVERDGGGTTTSWIGGASTDGGTADETLFAVLSFPVERLAFLLFIAAPCLW